MNIMYNNNNNKYLLFNEVNLQNRNYIKINVFINVILKVPSRNSIVISIVGTYTMN